MDTVESQLAEWRSAYGEWVLAELQLREAQQRQPGSPALAILQAKTCRLQRRCSDLQDAISSRLADDGRGAAADRASAADPELAPA
ncbi:hypothetical protein [Ramlibacter sp.]|uniref:hypothetical protein n=1 Tax=Ramlibacter sp. TaxID=1917967 RepID=UPI002CD0EF27|nr:hypothetical protein [Ramlibacter sp.]HWI83207.1 hypothetical protein [Ramlibacter sp.]